ncbi:hypothetical protein D0962_37675 [Leptolyngbyaceae cyanobacterium CCMR0082]|uniref:Uncharacterized protein n=1 Tax=Adonisia turfae CCMR0082 TaxID=2304604 RepID=A0A6M0SIY3_9CYAN|nr:hypothetical protein [Adonisia turfae]NEZ68385.1 hypothetical protein [Adonisia turfae CCMR0082]
MKKLTRLKERNISGSTAFKWEAGSDVGVVHSRQQIASIYLDPQGFTMSIALFLKDEDSTIYPITAQSINGQNADLLTPLGQWVEDYNLNVVVAPYIEGLPEEANNNLDKHPVTRILKRENIGWEIHIAEKLLPRIAQMKVNALKREGKLNLDFFEAAAKIQELQNQQKFSDGQLMAYLQGFTGDWEKFDVRAFLNAI